jgi:alpha-tubulin suppressor-like RCC1 family protein
MATCVNGACGFACNPSFLHCGNACCTAIGIGTGFGHTCAITSVGTVKCWGANFLGQLGLPVGDGGSVLNPTDVPGVAVISGISLGDETTCVSAGPMLRCWGNNMEGELGDGTLTSRSTPEVVGGGNGLPFTAFTTDYNFVCGVIADAGSNCWGDNRFGELGRGIDGGTYPSPGPVESPVSLYFGRSDGFHTCAVDGTGNVWCWGSNLYGEVGINSSQFVITVPMKVAVLGSGNSSVVGGEEHTCAVTAGGGVSCWGDNMFGQMGVGLGTPGSAVPEAVPALSGGISLLSAGGNHTCALSKLGGLQCWGDGESGEIGDGMSGCGHFVGTPADVVGMSSGVIEVSAGTFHTCAIASTGGVYCWGDNEFGQIGDGTTIDRSVPTPVISP